MKKHIWIIEMKEKVGWRPTTGSSLTREDARIDLDWWKMVSSDKYRICKYIPDPEQFKAVEEED